MLKDSIKNQANGRIQICQEAKDILSSAGVIHTTFPFSSDPKVQVEQAKRIVNNPGARAVVEESDIPIVAT